MVPVRIAVAGREQRLAELDLPLDLNQFLLPPVGSSLGDWEVEIGFGKGMFLLEQAQAHPTRGFLGVEVASKYYRRVRDRAVRDHLDNLVLVRGEARYLLAAVLPDSFAKSVHVYFPDPWPKSRHQERRLFDTESLDLLLRLLKPGGVLNFATDFLEYGRAVRDLLEAHPALRVREARDLWDGRARTHYERKYQLEGREILRFEAQLESEAPLFHPLCGRGVVAATEKPPETDSESEKRA